MKRIGKILLGLMMLAMLSAACSQYVCPAYSLDTSDEQLEQERG